MRRHLAPEGILAASDHSFAFGLALTLVCAGVATGAGGPLPLAPDDPAHDVAPKLREHDALLRNFARLRIAISDVRLSKEELRRLPHDAPRRAALEGEQQAATKRLARFGFTSGALPGPGDLFVDPRFTGAHPFPGTAHPPVVDPPSVDEALFGRGRPVRLLADDGTVRQVSTPAEFRNLVQRHREQTGMPVHDGEPIAVQLNLQGGGGGGKRYGAALPELLNQGVVPVSISGTSAGSIAAAMLAAGADAKDLRDIVMDPALSSLFDVGIHPEIRRDVDGLAISTGLDGGLLAGKAAYDFVDRKLRELTGITDRPVLFADLRIPLQIVTTLVSDTRPEERDLTTRAGRLFVFSQRTTPHTPVALAVRASMSIPGLFTPVMATDPLTGRTVGLMDGGLLDNLPMGYGHFALPELGISLLLEASTHLAYAQPPQPLPSKLDPPIDQSIAKNAEVGQALSDLSGRTLDDHLDRTAPGPGQFLLALPMWSIADPDKRDEVTVFEHDPEVDDVLDEETRAIVRRFLATQLSHLRDPKARATNLPVVTPEDLRFEEPLDLDGVPYLLQYAGGDAALLVRQDCAKVFANVCIRDGEEVGPRARHLVLGQVVFEALVQDSKAFGGRKRAFQHAVSLAERGQLGRLRATMSDLLRIENWAGFDPILRRTESE